MSLEQKVEKWVRNVTSKVTLPLRIELWNGAHFDLGPAPSVTVRVGKASSLPYLLTPSLFNLGTAYVDGHIDIIGSPGEILNIGGELASKTIKREGRFARIRRSLRRSKSKEAAAISYHYDVSNDFYQLWLGPEMVYSCAYFEHGNEQLAEAQMKKIDHVLDKLAIAPGDTLLDIGCG